VKTALIFPGQGAQYVGMGVSLYENNDVAKGMFLVAERILGIAFTRTCFEGPEEILTQTSVCQPALFVHSCAAVSMLRRLSPSTQHDFAFGLSLGELIALWTAGVFDFEDGLRVVYERGRLMQKACEEVEGAMLCLIGGTGDDVATVCDASNVEISNINCPDQVIISGEKYDIHAAKEIAEKMSFKRVLQLNVAGAYHSRFMESAATGFEKFLNNMEFQNPTIHVITNVTGEVVNSPEEIKKTLVKQIVSPVLFEKCCRKAIEMGVTRFFECGPGRTLSGMLKKISKDVTTKNFDKMSDFHFEAQDSQS
jgi:[acyl-carrier-protein] S-malonyltransferase